jgi:hypothetical protein
MQTVRRAPGGTGKGRKGRQAPQEGFEPPTDRLTGRQSKRTKRRPGPTPKAARPAARLAISLEPSLAEEVRQAAEQQAEGNISAWLAEAARDRIRHTNMRAAVDQFLAENGPFSKEVIEEGLRQWPED